MIYLTHLQHTYSGKMSKKKKQKEKYVIPIALDEIPVELKVK